MTATDSASCISWFITNMLDVNESQANDQWMNISSGGSLPQLHHRLRQAIFISYLATVIFGIAGNGLVIYIIAHYKNVRTKSVANYYIWNLSFADLFFTVTLIFFCYGTFYQDWPFGSFLCKMSSAIRETNRFASIFTLVGLSLDRYIASFYNLGYMRTIRVGQVVCAIIWLMCLGISVPYWLYADVHTTNNNRTSCRFLWPGPKVEDKVEMWTYFQFFAGLVMPCVLIFGSYILLACRMKALYRKSSRILKPSRRMTRTVIVVVLIFLVCQTPWHAVQFMSLQKVMKAAAMQRVRQRYMPDRSEFTLFVTLNTLAQILVFLSSCCNPIIYGLLNDNYRKLYSTVMCRCRRQPVSEQDVQEAGSCDSDQPVDSENVAYRFEITFHLPCSGPHSSKKKRRVPSTENMELEDKSVHLLANHMVVKEVVNAPGSDAITHATPLGAGTSQQLTVTRSRSWPNMCPGSKK